MKYLVLYYNYSHFWCILLLNYQIILIIIKLPVDGRLPVKLYEENMTELDSGNAAGSVSYCHEQSLQFATHMLALPRQDFCPLRSAFDPVDIPFLLPRIILRDREADGTYRYRLVGTELQAYFGQELTGKTLGSWIGDRAVGPLQAAFDRTREQPCGLVNILKITYGSDPTTLLECVTFPLAGPSLAQSISHVAILDRPADLRQVQMAQAVNMSRMVGIDLGAGVADFSDITW